MKTSVTIRRTAFAKAIKDNGIDINKDFYSLSFEEISKVDEIRKSFGYDGSNYLGRSRVRQFWYSAQKGGRV